MNGMYMTFPHDHEKWLADKKAWQKKAKKRKKSDGDDSKDKESSEGSEEESKKAKSGKLALSKKMSAALCSSFCVSEPQAEQFIAKLYEDIEGDQGKD